MAEVLLAAASALIRTIMAEYNYKCQVCEKEATVYQSVGDYCKSPNVPPNCECGGEFKRWIKMKEQHDKVKGFILLGDHGWHDREYTKHRSIK